MRNRYPDDCYRCTKWVAAGEGHFERLPGGGWRVQHADCAIAFRGQPDPVNQARNERQHARTVERWTEKAAGTGRAAQRARRRLRDMAAEART